MWNLFSATARAPWLMLASLILALLIACLVATAILQSARPLPVAIVGAGLLTFAFCMQYDGATQQSFEYRLRSAIAITVVIEYLVMVGVFASYTAAIAEPPITQTIMTSFTTVVGVVIAFYFGASAFVRSQESRKHGPPSDDHEPPQKS